MKKLMYAFAIAACAMVANASNVQWGLIAGESLDSTKVDAGTAYLCYTTGTLDWTVLSTASEFTAATLTEVGFTDVWDSFDYSSSKISSNVTITPTSKGPTSNTAIGGGAKSFYYVVIDDGGKDIAYTETAKTINIVNSVMGTNSYVASSSFSYATAVPEPTSGLLLLLGMAGLALKRKIA